MPETPSPASIVMVTCLTTLKSAGIDGNLCSWLIHTGPSRSSSPYGQTVRRAPDDRIHM